MSTSVTVKTYLARPHISDRPEVRRFTIEHANSSSYTNLNRKLLQVYPLLKKTKYEVCWKGEQIATNLYIRLNKMANETILHNLYIVNTKMQPHVAIKFIKLY